MWIGDGEIHAAWNRVRRVLEGLTEERLAARTEPVDGPGYPPADTYLVTDCLGTVLIEEWEHRLYAERDLAVLRARLSGEAQSVT